ncbi:MAG: four helix bundle protein [Ignavibacteria bacterium]|nr:four helix bundle protein [Ignavibacteria bacterium]
MERENIVKDKSYKFALRIVNLYKFLTDTNKEYVLSKQILRCGSSIGANIEESIGCSTKKDFVNKISIAYRESRETRYWLNLLFDAKYRKKYSESLIADCEEMIKLTGKIISSSKKAI